MGKWPASSHSSQCGLISFCTKSRTVFLRASCSAVNFTVLFSCCFLVRAFVRLKHVFYLLITSMSSVWISARSEPRYAKGVGPELARIGFPEHVEYQCHNSAGIPWINQAVIP